MTFFLENVLDGLGLAGVYLLVALGITLIFGLTRLVFFAQGELVTLGAFLSFTLVQVGVPIALAILISGIGVGVFGEVIDLTLLRRTQVRPMNGFIISLGLIVALEAFYAIYWSGAFYQIPPILSGTWVVGGIPLNEERLLLIAVTLAVAAGLILFLNRTHFGRGIRALAEDRTSARVLGVRVGPLTSLVFFVGCSLAAIAGGLLGTIFPFTDLFGPQWLLIGFAVAIVGGLGNVRGAIVGALVLALAQTLGEAYVSLAWSYAILLVAMILIILVRPYGIFARSSSSAAADPLHGSNIIPGGDDAVVHGQTPSGRILSLVPRLSIFALIALGLAAPELLLGSAQSLSIATFALVNAIAVYSLWFGFRFAGILSIAQVAFVGVGAYTTAIVAVDLGFGFWPQLILAVLMSSVAATVFGFIALRATGSYLIILLFALTELQVVVLQNWTPLTGGTLGIVLPTPPDPLFGLVDFSNPTNFYYLVFVGLFLIVSLLYFLASSSFGRTLRSLRDNDLLAQSLGLNVYRYRLATLALIGGCAGFGGMLYMYTQVAVEPDYFNTTTSIQLILMMLLGGVGTIAGPAVGAMVAGFLPYVLQLSPEQAELVYGLALIALIVFLPGGVVGSARHLMEFTVRRLVHN